MNDREFQEQLQAMSKRVLNKTVPEEDTNNYTEPLFESIRFC